MDNPDNLPTLPDIESAIERMEHDLRDVNPSELSPIERKFVQAVSMAITEWRIAKGRDA
jgi:hypothetical protein